MGGRYRYAIFTIFCIMHMIVAEEEDENSEEDMGDVIGIDLGTTFSCVGVYRHGKVEIIPNEQGNRITPSFVGWDPITGARLVGDAAKNQAAMHPKHTVFDVKRLIGREFSEELVQKSVKNFPFEVVNKDNRPRIRIELSSGTKFYSPEEISAMVLTKMKNIAETKLGRTVKHAVITVPAYFNDAQRAATKNAGRIAGLKVERIFNEPTAAALAFGLDRATNRGEDVPGDEAVNIVVYDLGGGTLDVTLLTIEQGVFEVLATSGNTHLGGEDFDQRVLEHFASSIKQKHKTDLTPSKTGDLSSARRLQRLRREVERAKRELSVNTKTLVSVESLLDGAEADWSEVLTRAKFEELNADLFKQAMEPLTTVLKDADMDLSEIESVVLVGGSTRIPKVRKLVNQFFKKGQSKIDTTTVNPDEAVAYGAALQGGILSGHHTDTTTSLLLLDVIPLSLGMETGEYGGMEFLIKRGTTIPVAKTQEFTTQLDNQQAITNRIFEGERPLVKDNHKLGEFMLRGIRPAPKGKARIQFTFEVDANGILTVTAKELGNEEASSSIRIDRDAGGGRLSEKEIEQMIREAELAAAKDRNEVERIKALTNLERFIYDTKQYLEGKHLKQLEAAKNGGRTWDESTVKSFLGPEEWEGANEGILEVLDWIEQNSKEAATETVLEKLNDAKEAFGVIVQRLEAEIRNSANAEDEPAGEEETVDDEYDDL